MYSQRHNPPISILTPTILSLDPVKNDDLPIALRKVKSQCVHSISSFVTYNNFSSSSCSFIASLDYVSLPNIVREALSHPNWRSAMVGEMQALDDNGSGTWCLYLPARRLLVVGCLQ